MDAFPLAIIHQDHYLLIVNKPAYLVIHPTYKHTDGDTLWDHLLAHLAQQAEDEWRPQEPPDDPEWLGAPPAILVMLREKRLQRLWREDGLLPRPCLVHRLDKDTSGVVALARTENARRHLIKQFHAHTIDKRYLTVVHAATQEWAYPRAPFTLSRRMPGVQECPAQASVLLSAAPGTEFLLDGPLQRDPDDRRRSIVGLDGQEATTLVTLLAWEEPFALLEVRPVTGRTHQIRAHLAALGCAIVGDQTYAPPPVSASPAALLSRQFLHAYRLSFQRYPENSWKTFVAPLAPDLLAWLSTCSPTLFKTYQELVRPIL